MSELPNHVILMLYRIANYKSYTAEAFVFIHTFLGFTRLTFRKTRAFKWNKDRLKKITVTDTRSQAHRKTCCDDHRRVSPSRIARAPSAAHTSRSIAQRHRETETKRLEFRIEKRGDAQSHGEGRASGRAGGRADHPKASPAAIKSERRRTSKKGRWHGKTGRAGGVSGRGLERAGGEVTRLCGR